MSQVFAFLNLKHAVKLVNLQEICVLVGVILHYIYLAAFMWMVIEGHHLYLKVIRVFDTGFDYSRIYLIVGYGIPLLIVVITGIVTASLQDTGYANDELS